LKFVLKIFRLAYSPL
jgi:hypothetical protein